MHNFPDSLYLHAFNLLPQFGPNRLTKIAENFESFEHAFKASKNNLQAAGLEPELIEKFFEHKEALNLSAEQNKLEKENIKLLTYKDPLYPKLLLEIPKFPPLLYYKGVLLSEEELCIAVVGTRKITTYGRTVTPALVEPLSSAGVSIVSGMAFGVDTLAHETVFQSNRRTIAVLGGGLDEKSLYPAHHALVAQKILQANGLLLSEYPIGTPALKHHFIARNRIISGLCVATIIIECDVKSGSLITAQYALEQNRTVYAVPGPIYSPQSQGPHNLIKMGAKLITKASDVLEDLNLKELPQALEAQSSFGDSAEETTVLGLLDFEPKNVTDLVKSSGLETSTVISTLTFLEMKGKIKNLGAQQYILSR